MSERVIGIVHKLYQMRRAAHFFFGQEYAENTRHLREVLGRIREQQKVETLEAAMWLARRVDPNDVRELSLIFAAALDEIEPEEGSQCSQCGSPPTQGDDPK